MSSPPSSPSTSPSPLRTSSARPVSSPGTGLVAVVGRDTRISGQFLEAAVVAGLASAGVDVLLLGVLPTPGVAFLTDVARRRPRRDALRLPQPDARQRHQVPRPRRRQARRRHRGRDREAARASPGTARPAARVGRVTTYDAGRRRLRRPPRSTVDHAARRPQGRPRLRRTAPPPRPGPRALRDAGAEVVAICAEPDGLNINDGCGSTHLERAAARRRSSTAPTSGFALDGDADRCLAVDARGQRRRRRPDPGHPRAGDARRRHARRRHRRGHRDEQPRLRAGDARRRASACGRPRSATATCSRR